MAKAATEVSEDNVYYLNLVSYTKGVLLEDSKLNDAQKKVLNEMHYIEKELLAHALALVAVGGGLLQGKIDEIMGDLYDLCKQRELRIRRKLNYRLHKEMERVINKF